MSGAEILVVFLVLALYSLAGTFISEIKRVQRYSYQTRINHEPQYYLTRDKRAEIDMPEFLGFDPALRPEFSAIWAWSDYRAASELSPVAELAPRHPRRNT